MSSSGIDRIGQLRDRSRSALDAPGALVDRGQVGVHVAGVAAATGDLVARGRDLAQRLAVVGHVGHDDQHVHVVLERQVLGGGERAARGQQALESSGPRPGSGTRPLAPARRELSKVRRKNDASRCVTPIAAKTTTNRSPERTFGLRGDLRGDLVRRQPEAAEDRQLLAAHEASSARRSWRCRSG